MIKGIKNMTQEEFTKEIKASIMDKVFFSNLSGEMAEVVDKLPEDVESGKVLFDGMMLFDGIAGGEDDIQQVCSLTKDGNTVNMEDYYTDNGAFEDDGFDGFLDALERLMTFDEFLEFLKDK